MGGKKTPPIVMDKINSMLGMNEITVEKVLDFLPYPFLVSEWRAGTQQNLFVNRNFVEEIGYTCNDIPTITDWFERAYPDAGYRADVIEGWRVSAAESTSKGLDHVTMKARIQTRQLGTMWYEVKASVFGNVSLVAFVNIDDEVAKENALEKLNEDKNRILSILTHDVRSPLTNLHGLLTVADEGLVTREEYDDALKKIRVNTFNLIEFIDTTLQWTRANFEGINPSFQKIALPVLIEGIILLYEKSCAEKKIKLQIDLKVEMIVSDPGIINIVFRNILSNAIKFTSGGEISISSRRAGADDVLLEVTDTGTGIGDDQIRSIMTGQYKSVDGTRREKGFGLGLRLCKDLLEKIDSRLELSSVVNKGTTVRITISNH